MGTAFLCGCGHGWILHDIYEQSDAGNEVCCVEGCDQNGCPGRDRPQSIPEDTPPFTVTSDNF